MCGMSGVCLSVWLIGVSCVNSLVFLPVLESRFRELKSSVHDKFITDTC